MKRSVYLGWDSREAAAFAVARTSLMRHMDSSVEANWLMLPEVRAKGLYSRPIEYRVTDAGHSVMWDVISDAPMSTEHACSRFLVPHLAKEGWALFADCDVLFRTNVGELFEGLDPSKAVYCVQHKHEPTETEKMDHQVQMRYARKNWSSVVAFNVEHPSNAALTVDMVNELPGRDLHRFCWLADSDIGALDPAWNHLVGVNPPMNDAKIVHFTLGCPNMPGYWECEFADEWRRELLGHVA